MGWGDATDGVHAVADVHFGGAKEDGGACALVRVLQVPYLEEGMAYGIFLLRGAYISESIVRGTHDAPQE